MSGSSSSFESMVNRNDSLSNMKRVLLKFALKDEIFRILTSVGEKNYKAAWVFLNDMHLTIQEDLLSILIRFRMYCVVLSADIEKKFR